MNTQSQYATPGVVAQISAVMHALSVSGIGKDGYNEAQKFHFRGIDAIHNALAPLLVKEGLVVVPAVLERTTEKRERSGKDPLYFVVVKVQYTVLSKVDGSSLVTGPFYGEAMDSGDKATNKAMSIAYKYWAIQTLCIPLVGSDDPDASGENADVGALKQAMTDAKTVDELRARTGEALAALGKGHDEYADVVAYGKALAARLTAVKQPTAKQAETPDTPAENPPASKPAAEKPAAAKGAPASRGLIQSVRNIGETKGFDDADLITALWQTTGLVVEKLEDLDKAQAASLLAAVTKMESK